MVLYCMATTFQDNNAFSYPKIVDQIQGMNPPYTDVMPNVAITALSDCDYESALTNCVFLVQPQTEEQLCRAVKRLHAFTEAESPAREVQIAHAFPESQSCFYLRRGCLEAPTYKPQPRSGSQ